MTKNVSFYEEDPNIQEGEYQPVFLSLQFNHGFSLEFSISTKNNLNHVTIELLNEGRDIICKESFKYKIEEFKWYNIIITKTNEQKYVLFYFFFFTH